MAFYSNKLKQLRTEKGLTQRELADKIGLGKSAVGMYESGKRTPEFETLEAICDFFNVNMDLLSDVKSPIVSTHSDEEDLLASKTATGSHYVPGVASETMKAISQFYNNRKNWPLLDVLSTFTEKQLEEIESYAQYIASKYRNESSGPVDVDKDSSA